MAELGALLADPVVRATMTTITLAPELEGAVGAIARLHDAGVVVSIGHGRIAVGSRADLVWWDDALTPRRVWVGGVPV